MGADTQTLLLKAYPKNNLQALKVPKDVYRGKKSMEVSSMRHCRIISHMQCWDCSFSYRIPGKIVQRQGLCVFFLRKGERISPAKKL